MNAMDVTEATQALSLKHVEWTGLHTWVLAFRDDNKLSISGFLHSSDLDPRSNYYHNLVSGMGGRYRPSTGECTAGQLFRQRITAVKLRGEVNPLKSDRDSDFA